MTSVELAFNEYIAHARLCFNSAMPGGRGVTLKMLADNEDARLAEAKQGAKRALDLSFESTRGDKPVFEMIAGSSSDADLVFMGMCPENEESLRIIACIGGL